MSKELRDNTRSSGSCRIISEKNVLQLALDLHQHNTGSSDSLLFEDKDIQVYNDLKEVIEFWKENNGKFNDFDSCVKRLIESVIREYETEEINCSCSI